MLVDAVGGGRTKVTSWHDLLQSDYIIHERTLRLHVPYAYVQPNGRGGIRPPGPHVGIMFVRSLEPYGQEHPLLAGVERGEPVVRVAVRATTTHWARPVYRRASALGLIETTNPEAVMLVCVPHYRLGMLQYE